jgi:hypothetical protein
MLKSAKGSIGTVIVLSGLLLSPAPLSMGAGHGDPNPGILSAQAHPYGKSYFEWVAAFWKWGLEFPLDGPTAHPFLDDPSFDFSARQSGRVWFWAAPDGPLTRTVTLPLGTTLFLSLRDTECSSLEDPPFHGDTEQEQRQCAKFWADHIRDVFCNIDGTDVTGFAAYRFSSPQFSFNAPTPWIFGGTGGPATAVADGYYLMLAPLSEGQHTIHYGGTFHFDAGEIDVNPVDFPKDITIEITVVGRE